MRTSPEMKNIIMFCNMRICVIVKISHVPNNGFCHFFSSFLVVYCTFSLHLNKCHFAIWFMKSYCCCYCYYCVFGSSKNEESGEKIFWKTTDISLILHIKHSQTEMWWSKSATFSLHVIFFMYFLNLTLQKICSQAALVPCSLHGLL